MKTPSPAAVKAATMIQEEIKSCRRRTGCEDVIPGTNDLGAIIDSSRADLVEALKWAMDKEPSPCRCIPFATPPHVCVGHRAILDSENASGQVTAKE